MSLELKLEPESGQHDIAQVLVVRRNQGLGLLGQGPGAVLSLADCEIICPLGLWLTRLDGYSSSSAAIRALQRLLYLSISLVCIDICLSTVPLLASQPY